MLAALTIVLALACSALWVQGMLCRRKTRHLLDQFALAQKQHAKLLQLLAGHGATEDDFGHRCSLLLEALQPVQYDQTWVSSISTMGQKLPADVFWGPKEWSDRLVIFWTQFWMVEAHKETAMRIMGIVESAEMAVETWDRSHSKDAVLYTLGLLSKQLHDYRVALEPNEEHSGVRQRS
jgi:hypothetical protein